MTSKLLRKNNGKWEPTFIDAKFDLCNFANQLKKNELLQTMMGVMLKANPSLAKGCPLQVILNCIFLPFFQGFYLKWHF